MDFLMLSSFFNDQQVGEIEVMLSNINTSHVFESTIPFNKVELTIFDVFPIANWVVPSLRIPSESVCNIARPIPTISQWGLIAMAGVLGL